MHLYLHVPYCDTKCPYCDFNSIAGREEERDAYVSALLSEVRSLPRGPYATVFLGGGTPTALDPGQLARLLEGVRAHVALADGYEWTCEANPGSADAGRFAVLAEHGVDRLSVGVQSVHDHHLRFLGRAHDAVAAERALAAAREAVPRVSADLIVGLPGQTRAELAREMDLYRRHDLAHASVYHLAIEPGTEFHARWRAGRLRVVDEAAGRELLERAWDRLAALGLEAYETSNFARPGQECRHNLAYWTQRDYHAAGAGAVSTVARRRVTREPHPARYIQAIRARGDATWRVEELDDHSVLVEAWMLGLRLARGVDPARLERLGDREERWGPIAAGLEREGLLARRDGRLRLTGRGRAVQDAVTVALLPERSCTGSAGR